MGGKRGEFNMSSQPKRIFSAVSALALVLTAWMARSPGVVADEAQARSLLKAMTDYVGAQQVITFEYDATLEVVTKDRQKLQLASSGMVSLARPDKIRTTRSGGFVDIETVFDGKTLTLFGKNKNVYTQVEAPGSVDNLVNELQKKYDRPIPAADLFLTHAYDEMTGDVTDVKDLGSGVIGGIECDYFAFRAKDVDWQIWVTQGARPRPCRYVITSTGIADGPQYTVQLRNWKTGSEAAKTDFAFKPPAGARKIDLEALKTMKDMGELPSHFVVGDK